MAHLQATPSIPTQKSTLPKEVLERLRSRLLEEKRQLITAIARLGGILAPEVRETYGLDWADQGNFKSDHYTNAAQLHFAEGQLDGINHALVLMDQEQYGICTHCHENINPERLEICPATDHCSKSACTPAPTRYVKSRPDVWH